MSLSTAYLAKIKDNLHTYAEARQQLIGQSNKALHHAKRVIFSLHRGDAAEAKTRHAAAETLLLSITKTHKKNPKLLNEGSLKAAIEEFVEASLFLSFVEGKSLGKLPKLVVPEEVYLAGLADVPGELYRYAVRAATERDVMTVKRCNDAASDIIGALIDMDLTSYLRTKADQAKSAARKLEHVVYELSLRQ